MKRWFAPINTPSISAYISVLWIHFTIYISDTSNVSICLFPNFVIIVRMKEWNKNIIMIYLDIHQIFTYVKIRMSMTGSDHCFAIFGPGIDLEGVTTQRGVTKNRKVTHFEHLTQFWKLPFFGEKRWFFMIFGRFFEKWHKSAKFGKIEKWYNPRSHPCKSIPVMDLRRLKKDFVGYFGKCQHI